jgi:N-acetylneuraminic acid mutarotase
MCGPAACVPKTCAQLGANCGAVSDGCGGLLSCGSCNWPQTCGGAGTPSVCGTNPSCTNLCLQQATCAGNATTKVTGTVYAPNGVDPLPNAVVYVPNAPVSPFTTSVSCDNCAQASGSPLVGTTSAVDGKFTLTNVPAGTNIPLVIQIGRWRRQVSIPTVTACTTTPVSASLTRLPKNKTEGDIPKQAFVTGEKDALECVLRKIGVEDTEFSNALGNGRIHLYAAAGPGSIRSTAATSAVNHGAVLGGVGPAAASAITPTGATEWDFRLLDTHAWLMADSMSYSRAEHAATLLDDGRVLVAGGFGAVGAAVAATTASLNTVEIYDPSTNTWTTKAAMSAQRAGLTATRLPSGKVLVAGGLSGATYSATAEVYNPATNTWVATSNSIPGGARARHTATLLGNGKVLVVGGMTTGGLSTATAALYDPVTSLWLPAGPLATGRFYHSATLLANGKVLIAGGVNSGTTSVSSAELYNPATNTFSAAPAMPAVRQQHSETLLASGKVLLVGGVGASTASIATTAIYDPTANSWAAGASLASARKGHEAALLSDGTVVAFGGVDGTTYRTTEETYNPTANTWAVVATGHNETHAFLTATTLQNGRVLMAGGYTTGGGLLGHSEILINQPLNQYDITLFPCPGNAYYYPTATQQRYQNNLANYANVGGRVFTTHYTYSWIYSDSATYFSPLSSAVGWGVNQANPTPDPQAAIIDQTFAKGALLAQWLKLPAVGASSVLGQITVDTLRHDYNSVNPPTQNWTKVNQPSVVPMHLTFNTPIGAASANQCGRVVFSDFHVEDRSSDVTKDKVYPAECDATLAMTPQEKLLEFMMFDLASCVTPDTIPACVPKTCGQLGLNCGQAGDGCGGTLSCGSCTAPQVCGWGSTPNVCATPVACVPTTCSALGLSCGPAGNGCGGTLNCGSCPSPQVCGAGGPGQCGLLTSQCVPRTCTALGLSCGPAGDGCGGTLNCGSCTSPQTCGGGGQRGQCGSPPACVPRSCAAQGLSCGVAGDGCGGTLNCGSCSAPDTCGGGGQPGTCGHGTEYTSGSFVRDYSSSCPAETTTVWSLWSWNATTPSDSHIDFTVQTAATAAELASAPSDALLFSTPPGPTSQLGRPASAHAANQPAGTPNTEIGAADVDNTFVVNNRPRHNAYVRITSNLVPSSNRSQTALLGSWNLQMDCAPNQ